MPSGPGSSHRIAIRLPTLFFTKGGQNLRLFINPYTGDELKESGVEPKGPFSWYRKNFGRLHTFGTYGSFVQVVWGLLSGVGGILVITGVWVSVKAVEAKQIKRIG